MKVKEGDVLVCQCGDCELEVTVTRVCGPVSCGCEPVCCEIEASCCNEPLVVKSGCCCGD